MKYLKIQNTGELDVRLISLMGGTTKTGNSYKIGRFGTGLKYALAWLMRNNVEFKIFIGMKEIQIETKPEKIQGTDFDVLYINGERSSISSTMGADWQGWMICRELFCNAIDEGGLVKEETSTLVGEEGRTTFYVQLTGEIKETVDNWTKFFLHGITPLYETSEFAIYPPSECLRLYKNGVLILEDTNLKSVYSYDIKNATINELREYKGSKNLDIVTIITDLDAKHAELFLANLKDGMFEYDMDYEWYKEFKQPWKEAIGQAKIIAVEDLRSLKDRGVEIDEAGVLAVPKGLFAKLSNRFPTVSAVRRAEKVSAFYEQIDSEAEMKVKAALAILESCNYEYSPELKFIYGVFGNPSTLACINRDEKVIMFSTELKRKSMFDVVTTVIEEFEHWATGYSDCSRNFQQHFIDLYAKQILERNKVEL